MTSDFFSLLGRLVRAKVEFVIVGGFAGVVHGCTFVTLDMDICCEFSPKNLFALQEAIADFNPVHRRKAEHTPLELDKESCGRFKNLYLDTDIGQLDCVSTVDGIGNYEQVKRASQIIKAGGLRLRVLTLDALIESKLAMNRPRDKQVLLELEAIKKLSKPRK